MAEFLNASQLAARLQVTPATVLAWARRGWIPSLRAGQRPVLFDPDDVEQALRRRAQGRKRRSGDYCTDHCAWFDGQKRARDDPR